MSAPQTIPNTPTQVPVSRLGQGIAGRKLKAVNAGLRTLESRRKTAVLAVYGTMLLENQPVEMADLEAAAENLQ